jgi:hypothetical protein
MSALCWYRNHQAAADHPWAQVDRAQILPCRSSHPGGDQLMPNVCRRPGVPRSRSDPCGLGQDVVAAIGDDAQFLDRFVEVAAFDRVAHRGAVEGDIEEPAWSGHAPAYRTSVRVGRSPLRAALHLVAGLSLALALTAVGTDAASYVGGVRAVVDVVPTRGSQGSIQRHSP